MPNSTRVIFNIYKETAEDFLRLPHSGFEPESLEIADQVRDEVYGSAVRFAKRFSSKARFFFSVVQAVGLFLIRITEKASLFGFADERIENVFWPEIFRDI